MFLSVIKDADSHAKEVYLEPALAAEAAAIVSSDQDLPVLHTWRGVAILRPAEHLVSS